MHFLTILLRLATYHIILPSARSLLSSLIIEQFCTQADVRAATVSSLGHLNAQEYADAISELLGDVNRGVRNAATSVMKRWGLA